MNTIVIKIPNEQWLKLQQLANNCNVSVEELVSTSIESLLNQQEISLKADVESEVPSEISNRFYILANQWEVEVEGISSTATMSEHPAYQEIISMGNKIVPLLLQELKKNPLYWLLALNKITGVNPIKPEQRGKVKQMAEAWLEWGKNQGYLV
ncbi:hypothetical protein CAL7716_051710 [Calothrix sp. PCC 7716]|nr:hypothetical protein CAL7716_051710 [Calothrix sp. PCC 7716]